MGCHVPLHIFTSIHFQPNCTASTNWTEPFTLGHDPCPSGWVFVNGSEVPPPPVFHLVWLFNLAEDPLEQNNLAGQLPDMV